MQSHTHTHTHTNVNLRRKHLFGVDQWRATLVAQEFVGSPQVLPEELAKIDGLLALTEHDAADTAPNHTKAS